MGHELPSPVFPGMSVHARYFCSCPNFRHRHPATLLSKGANSGREQMQQCEAKITVRDPQDR
jgi:hypothetical protein